MRGKKATINTAFNLLEQFITVACGLILPRLIMTSLGSQYNGLTLSITQFLSCAVLLRSGIGGATRAALYKPMAECNHDDINAIVKATDIFMKKIGLILAAAIVVFASVYPLFVKNEFGWLFTFTLFIIIGASTFAESFFGITYLIVLQADQRLWITSVLKCICYIGNTSIGALLLVNGCSIHAVKGVSALFFVAYPIILGAYVRRKYKIDKNVKPNNIAISQRWDAFWQQVAIFVTTNTDVMVLTVFSNMLEVSVYSVYNMVFDGLRRVITAFSNGLEAAFGNMIAKKEDEILHENVAIVETVIFGLSTFIYSCTALLILGFVNVYTKNVNDVSYIRPAFAYVLIVANFFNAVRTPYQLVVQAAGHYKQTKRGAIIEPIINLSISVILVFKFGLIGVAIGTLVATLFRTIQYSVYMSRHIVMRSVFIVVYRILVSFFECAVISCLVWLLHLSFPETYIEWFVNAIITSIISIVIISICSLIFFNKDTLGSVRKFKGVFLKKR